MRIPLSLIKIKLQIFSDRAQKIEDLVKLEIRMEHVEIFHGQVNAGISGNSESQSQDEISPMREH